MLLDVLRRELAQGAETIRGLVAGLSPAEARVRPAPAMLPMMNSWPPKGAMRVFCFQPQEGSLKDVVSVSMAKPPCGAE